MKIFNKKARFEYDLEQDRIEAGISLRGAEAKSIREGRGDLSQSHARIINGEAYLINANIPAPGIQNYDATRIRKLLLHKNQIISLETKMKQQRLQIVPIKLYNKGHLIKLELALGKPKRKFEKKNLIKKRDIEREIAQQVRGKNEQ